MSLLRSRRFASVILLGSLLLAACGTTSTSTKDSTLIQVVAAENFWGSIAAQVGGSNVHVTTIINEPSADPHSYEPTAVDARAVADAQYVISNGAGYDAWVNKLLAANPVPQRKTLVIGDFVGKKAGDNPHLWYNPEYVAAVINKMAADLMLIAPSKAAAINQSAQAFQMTGLSEYHTIITAIKDKFSTVAIGATESIFAYMAPALGLNLVTPPSYLKAVSEGTDIAAADEAAVEQQIRTKQITLLVYNSQNTPNNITALIHLAKANNIPVTTITETLTPASASFQEWQTRQLQGIAAALTQATSK